MVYDRECEGTHWSLPNDVMKVIRDSEGDSGGGSPCDLGEMYLND